MKTMAAGAVTTQHELAGSFIDHDAERTIIQPDRWQLEDAPRSTMAFFDLATDTPETLTAASRRSVRQRSVPTHGSTVH